jgi:feruloyl esterase
MRSRLYLVMAAPLLLTMPHGTRRPTHSTAATCERLAGVALEGTTITLAQPITEGSFTPAGAPNAIANLPPFCRVAGVIRPTSDSNIRFEVWLPLNGWSGRFVGVGNGGWAGNVNYVGLAAQIRRGNAAGSTDTGHPTASDLDQAKFAYQHSERLIDFAWRSVREMTLKAKALTRAFYEKHPDHSYWVGCSTGGKQGLMEAQRFPDDYDGILAGAPANNWTRLMHATFDVTAAGLDSAGRLAPDDLQMLNRAVLSACDKLDGVEDGVLEDPRRCRFDPASLQCQPGSAPGTCLTAAQLATVRRVYAGPRDPRTGAQLYPGLPFGSELLWQVLLDTDRPFPIALSFYRWVVFADSQWNWKTFDPRKPANYAALQRADSQFTPLLNAIDPDLGRFRQRGGKLIQHHGWNDQLISAENSIAYYESVVARSGRDKARALRDVQDFYRLYMVPGMFHCGGGPGPNVFDLQTALERWVEQKEAPEAVVATHSTNRVVDRSRPLCPYPKTAVYKGSGDTNDAASFDCRDVKR